MFFAYSAREIPLATAPARERQVVVVDKAPFGMQMESGTCNVGRVRDDTPAATEARRAAAGHGDEGGV